MFLFPGSLKLPATVAVFDCGTNSVLLLIARLESGGKIEPLFQAIGSPRLGDGLTGRGKLRAEAVARTLNALKSLQRKANRFKPNYSLIVGTNVFRRASNGKTVAKKFERTLGCPVFILTAQKEAHLEFLGATFGRKTNSRTVVVDVGGGSSEIIWGRGQTINRKVSLEIGAVRLKEKFPNAEQYTPAMLEKMKQESTTKLTSAKKTAGYTSAILTGGTATTLAAFSKGLKKYQAEKVHTLKTTPANLEKLVAKLSKLTLTERWRVLPFDPARADIIVPGGIILCEILRRLQIKKVIIPDHGLRWGVAYLIIESFCH